jgi:hypothetical protein
MNPQPDPIIGQLFALAILSMTAFYTYKAYSEGKSIDLNKLDNFTIGYLEQDYFTPQVIEKHFHETVKPVKIIKTNTETIKTERIIETKPNFESQQLYVDCIDTLVALGMKKKDAKSRAKFIFSTMDPQPSTVQEFLMIALRKI